MPFSPRSNTFDDVYFSVEDGLAETRHVFLAGNGLPGRWQGKARFTIAETGFGTGLNFLAAWKLFQETADKGARLDFISVEKFPLTAGQIAEYLEPWAGEFGGMLDVFCEAYKKKYPSTTLRFAQDDILLNVIFDDVNNALSKLEEKIDCWFLDGFKPASNPDMWSETVFKNMARLSNTSATFATFTAAGAVKRGLQEAGFTVEKCKGFGRKRDMLKGYL